MEIEQSTAQALAFPKPRYRIVERERRWLCREVPRAGVLSSEAITDLYVTGTRLRLREARPLDGGAPMLRVTRKADVDASTRLISSVYLNEEVFSLQARSPRAPCRSINAAPSCGPVATRLPAAFELGIVSP
jgi:hypothetical protein